MNMGVLSLKPPASCTRWIRRWNWWLWEARQIKCPPMAFYKVETDRMLVSRVVYGKSDYMRTIFRNAHEK